MSEEIISSAHLAAGRAVDQLRRQLGIIFIDGNQIIGACPVEGLTPAVFAQIKALPNAKLSLLITGARAKSLGIESDNNEPVRLDAGAMALPEILALADPSTPKKPQNNSEKMGEKSNLIRENAQTIAKKLAENTPANRDARLLHLAKYASLLPALLLVESKTFPAHWIEVKSADMDSYWNNPPLDIVELAQATLPIKGAENTRILALRTRWGTSNHLVLLVGDAEKNDAPLVRVHSSCITGDILGSLRCDCGDQLSMALEQMQKSGGGILIYLHQEGRGIGIANKLRAYALQEQGIDTYDANLMLGFDEDERDFQLAAAILKKLGVKKIRLMTNNPGKLQALENSGITIAERVPVVAGASPHSHGYLEAKGKKAGHLF